MNKLEKSMWAFIEWLGCMFLLALLFIGAVAYALYEYFTE